MAFIEGTPIFTDSGFKNIEDIGGRDKVLVRNFLGDAEFMKMGVPSINAMLPPNI